MKVTRIACLLTPFGNKIYGVISFKVVYKNVY